MSLCIRSSVVLLFVFYQTSSVHANETDTIFIRKMTGNQVDRIVTYINPSRDSWHYDSLKKTSLYFKKKSAPVFPYGIWIELSQYQQNLYLYYPCDLGNLFKIETSEDTLRMHMMETEDNRILLRKPIKDGFSFTLADPVNKKQQVNFYQIDKKRGLSVLEFLNGKNIVSRKLMVSSTYLNQFPMIVNECDAKVQEIDLEKIDFEKLLKDKNRL
jgi:hypothetical protein